MRPTLSSLSLWRLSGKEMTPSPRRSVVAPKSFLSVEMHCDVAYPMVALATPRTLSSPPHRRVPAADVCLRHEPPDFATRLVSAFCSSKESGGAAGRHCAFQFIKKVEVRVVFTPPMVHIPVRVTDQDI